MGFCPSFLSPFLLLIPMNVRCSSMVGEDGRKVGRHKNHLLKWPLVQCFLFAVTASMGSSNGTSMISLIRLSSLWLPCCNAVFVPFSVGIITHSLKSN